MWENRYELVIIAVFHDADLFRGQAFLAQFGSYDCILVVKLYQITIHHDTARMFIFVFKVIIGFVDLNLG